MLGKNVSLVGSTQAKGTRPDFSPDVVSFSDVRGRWGAEIKALSLSCLSPVKSMQTTQYWALSLDVKLC